MLKWSVNRRNQEHPMECSEPSNSEERDVITPRGPRKRRHSNAKRKRNSLPNKKVLECEEDKENQFTSTPIKSLDDLNLIEVFRDVSNLSPKERFETRHPALRIGSRRSLENHLESSCSVSPPVTEKKLKKRRSFLTPFRDFQVKKRINQSSEFFKHFEGVDSHIGVMPDLPNCDCKDNLKNVPQNESRIKKIVDIYAPTLPTFTVDYSPSSMKTTHCLLTLNKGSPSRSTPLKGVLETATKDCSQFKRPRVDHVNDFLQQISFLTSPEENNSTFIKPKKSKMSPLVKKIVDLGFSNKKTGKQRKGINDSSFINDLSLSEIVDAILDETGNNYNDLYNKNRDHVVPKEENELNETHEENMLNTEFEKNNSSLDSGFKSSATSETCHHLGENSNCKCNNNNNLDMNEFAYRTIINLDETFNERCVDRTVIRKRPGTNLDDYSEMETKRLNLTKEYENSNFALRRQKCVRRKKTDNEKCPNFDVDFKNCVTSSRMQLSNEITTNFNDNSFESSIVSDSDIAKMTDLHIHSTEEDNFKLNTPITKKGRLRKCLLFGSLHSLNGDMSSDIGLKDPIGGIELKITQVENELIVNGKFLFHPNEFFQLSFG